MMFNTVRLLVVVVNIGLVVSQTQVSNKCSPNPCKNGGSCAPNSSGFICACSSNTSGKLCEFLNACSSIPCKNGGVCARASTSTGYTCACKAPYSGEQCLTLEGEWSEWSLVTSCVIKQDKTFQPKQCNKEELLHRKRRGVIAPGCDTKPRQYYTRSCLQKINDVKSTTARTATTTTTSGTTTTLPTTTPTTKASAIPTKTPTPTTTTASGTTTTLPTTTPTNKASAIPTELPLPIKTPATSMAPSRRRRSANKFSCKGNPDKSEICLFNPNATFTESKTMKANGQITIKNITINGRTISKRQLHEYINEKGQVYKELKNASEIALLALHKESNPLVSQIIITKLSVGSLKINYIIVLADASNQTTKDLEVSINKSVNVFGDNSKFGGQSDFVSITDYNECVEDIDACNKNAYCFINAGTISYSCQCKDGFSGDGFQCVKEQKRSVDDSNSLVIGISIAAVVIVALIIACMIVCYTRKHQQVKSLKQQAMLANVMVQPPREESFDMEERNGQSNQNEKKPIQ